jgi:biotin carboxyl carrier protein
MRVQSVISLLAGTALAGLVVVAAPAQAADRPHFQMPFACGETWQGSSRPSHTPSPLAIDWNRDANDEGHLVVATAPGVVTSVVDLGDSSYGLYIVIDHGNGWTTLHAHLDKAFVVVGQQVDAGQVIALLGNSGNSTGAHLHYEQRLNSVDRHGVFGGTAFTYNTWLTSENCAEVPVVGRWTGGALSSVGVYSRKAAGGVFRERLSSKHNSRVTFGLPTDQPIVGDWDGDGRSNVGVYRTDRREFVLAAADGTTQSFRFGLKGDIAVTGDWNGDGRTDVGVFRPATSTFRLRNADGTVTRKVFGTASSLPVTGDWNGDGRWQVGAYDPSTSTFSLAKVDGGTTTVVFGDPSSLPAVGFWNVGPVSDLGVWDPATGVFSERVGPTVTTSLRFGHIR